MNRILRSKNERQKAHRDWDDIYVFLFDPSSASASEFTFRVRRL